jgi:T4 RnlA family RNA ligase
MFNSITLYKNLMTLCAEGDTFYFKDFEYLGRTLRIFNYRLSTWTEFLKPGALDCRGTTYDITDGNIGLVALPPQKFFNFEEGGADHSACEVRTVMEKLDGSLINTMLINGNLHVKSKGSVYSDQASDAAEYIAHHEELRLVLKEFEVRGFTVSLEYTAPHNRIVIGYQIPQLRILGVRSRSTGEYLLPPDFCNIVVVPPEYVVQYQTSTQAPGDINADCKALLEGEGCVVELVHPTTRARYLVKCKADKYCLLHKQKDNINSPRALFELAATQATDDIRGLFTGDQYVQEQITRMENYVFPLLNRIEVEVTEFCADNKHLPRKEYAIAANSHGSPALMSLKMNEYLGKPNNYPEYLIKKYSDYRPEWAHVRELESASLMAEE